MQCVCECVCAKKDSIFAAACEVLLLPRLPAELLLLALSDGSDAQKNFNVQLATCNVLRLQRGLKTHLPHK